MAESKSPSKMLSSAKAKVTGAVGDVIDAAKGYGKPDGDTGVGHYVGKAEDYLHKLHSPSHQPAQGAQNKAEPAPTPAPPAEVVAQNKAEPAPAAPPAEGGDEKKNETAAAGGSKGGIGGLMNKAKGLFK